MAKNCLSLVVSPPQWIDGWFFFHSINFLINFSEYQFRLNPSFSRMKFETKSENWMSRRENNCKVHLNRSRIWFNLQFYSLHKIVIAFLLNVLSISHPFHPYLITSFQSYRQILSFTTIKISFRKKFSLQKECIQII